MYTLRLLQSETAPRTFDAFVDGDVVGVDGVKTFVHCHWTCPGSLHRKQMYGGRAGRGVGHCICPDGTPVNVLPYGAVTLELGAGGG